MIHPNEGEFGCEISHLLLHFMVGLEGGENCGNEWFGLRGVDQVAKWQGGRVARWSRAAGWPGAGGWLGG